jgi:hypothetical protein
VPQLPFFPCCAPPQAAHNKQEKKQARTLAG